MVSRYKAVFVSVPAVEAAGNHRDGHAASLGSEPVSVERALDIPLRKYIQSRCVPCG